MASAIFQSVICAQCGEREAMVFIRRSGGPSEGCDIVLCESCANSRGINAGRGGLELNIDDLIGVGLDADRGAGKAASCASCGLEIGTLKREGRLGCSACADSFHDEILKMLGRRDRAFAGPPPDPSTAQAATSAVDQGEAGRLTKELEAALACEDYETAARLRDQLSLLAKDAPGTTPNPRIQSLPPLPGFPFDPTPFRGLIGPEDDVVLSSSARIYRDLVDLPFPGSPHGPSSPSRALLQAKIEVMGGWVQHSMSELGSASRRSLSERGIVPRGYAADDEAVVLVSPSFHGYLVLDEGDHLRLRTLLPGLQVEAALEEALEAVDRLGRGIEFAQRPDLGWICARVADCGLGSSLSANLHLPAITAAGMRDRLFRALLAEGFAIRGYYSSSEDSAGSVYELGLESSGASSAMAMAAVFAAALARVVAAERRARTEIADRGRSALIDAEGRAFGLTRYFGKSSTEETASLLSVLRLAALRGSLFGVDYRALGSFLMALGPASVALASGRGDLPPAGEEDSLRAQLVKKALAVAEYRIEEGA